MFNKFSEQLKSNSKPVNTFFEVNAKTLETLSLHQTELFTGLMSDSVKYMESVTMQTELQGVIAANAEFAESFRERITSASKETFAALNDMREQVVDVMKSSFDTNASTVRSDIQDNVEQTADMVNSAEKASEETTKTVAQAAQKATKDTAESAQEVTDKTAEATKAATQNAADEAKKLAEKAAQSSGPKKAASRSRDTTSATKKPATPKTTD
ncbi:hypothetical protein CA267_007340 [Alteromonas pelagimontana]|uniref:Phasin domain-containing protein n=1 Tax=Alteromonas pelagimontana TaxID=1858656 RepID=A0A6M4MBT4_9ALTE|nr:phasin family protein [Alteromonas pelagimontana]QJR80603.1 hypothetical protein CA267_007340 [Alteromonas pelagimontana]